MFTRRLTENRILGGALVAVFLVMWALNPGRFLRLETFQSMALQFPELGLLSLAMMIPMLSGGINLSLVATANLTGIVTALALRAWVGPGAEGATAWGGIALAFAAGLAVATLVGAVNGLLVAFADVSPILATLGTMTLVDGLAVIVSGGGAISGLPRAVGALGRDAALGVPLPMWLFVVFAVVTALGLGRSVPGFNLRMVGANPSATQFSGVRNRAVLLGTYLVSGLLCGVAGLVMLARFNSAKAGYGASYLLVTVLAAVLGGVSVTGGFGKVSGLVLALAILQMISSGLNLLRVSTYLTVAIWGGTLLLVMALRHFARPRTAG